MLHLGCGRVRLNGWLNVDLEAPDADLHWDLRVPLPLPAASAQRIFNEHFLEHLDLDAGLAFLRECRRLVAPGGVLRIAMPDLDFVLERFHDDWRDQDWLHWPEYQHVDTRVRMLNMAMHEWGHQYLYNRDELARRLRECGFGNVVFCRNGESEHPELRNLETREDSMLIAEAR
ncbi:MAG: methyltransferase domain-containing protein [Gammaproteobacteria bacterium]